jgi:small-conductance mechanosensitive channel
MKAVHFLFTAVHALMALLFALVSLALLWIAMSKGWGTLMQGFDEDSTLQMVEAMGVLAAAVVALQISQTVVEEEVVRDASIAGPTRVRRFLSRFLVVVVVALAIEALIATFKGQESPDSLIYSAALMVGVGAMLFGWGMFVHLNRSAEELEPEALQEATQEDAEISADAAAPTDTGR